MKLFMELSQISRCLPCRESLCLLRPAAVNLLVVVNRALIVQLKLLLLYYCDGILLVTVTHKLLETPSFTPTHKKQVEL
jgi:hypothetical protein